VTDAILIYSAVWLTFIGYYLVLRDRR